MRNTILTSSSAGNSGPSSATISNFSPWSLSVAASTTDRKFVAKVNLGDGELYEVSWFAFLSMLQCRIMFNHVFSIQN